MTGVAEIKPEDIRTFPGLELSDIEKVAIVREAERRDDWEICGGHYGFSVYGVDLGSYSVNRTQAWHTDEVVEYEIQELAS